MRKGALRKTRFRTARLDDLIVLGTLAGGDKVAGHIGKQQELFFQFPVVFIGLRQQRRRFFFEGGYLQLRGFRLVSLAGLHQRADLRGLHFLPRDKGVTLGLEPSSVGIQFEYPFNNSSRIKILDRELLNHMLRIVAERFYGQHLVFERYYRYVRLVFFLFRELDRSVNQCIQGMIPAHPHIPVRAVDRTSLADDDVAGFHDLSTEFLDAESFGMRLTAVL